MIDVMVLGGPMHGVYLTVIEGVDYIDIDFGMLGGIELARTESIISMNIVRHTILRLYSGKWVCVNIEQTNN